MPPATPNPNQLELGLFGHARALVTLGEVAGKFLVSDEQVRNWYDEGWLLAVPVGSSAKSQRTHIRIVRSSAEALYVHRMKALTGVEVPYKLEPQAVWWLEQITERARRGLSPG